MNKNKIRNSLIGNCKRCNKPVREYIDLSKVPDKPYKAVFDVTDNGIYCSNCFYKDNPNIK